MLWKGVRANSLGLLAALLLAALLAVLVTQSAEAAPKRQDPTPVAGSEECLGCHEGLRAVWHESAHGQATDDPVFVAAWEEAGQPAECLNCHTTGFDAATGEWVADGVACTTCHYPVVGNHPDRMMPTDDSSRLCGNCHLDTYAEWGVSSHGQEDMACSQCHNAHTTELRNDNVQQLCQTCHHNEGHYYSFTGHAREGLLCSDCHLAVTDSELGEGHGQRLHTFGVDLESCQRCHADDMHSDGNGAAPAGLQSDVSCTVNGADKPAVTEMTGLEATPPPASHPLVLAVPAGFGIVFGVMLSPWVQRRARRPRGEK